MNMSTYMVALLGISAVFYLMGYQPAAFTTLAGEVGTSEPIAQSLINAIGNIFTNPVFLAALGISAVASFLLSGGNFSVFFIVPLLLLSVFANMFILPSAFFFDPALPTFVKLFIGSLMNIFMLNAIISFVRGQ